MRGNSAQRVSTGHLDRKLVCPVVIWHKAPACLCAPPSTLARSAWHSDRHTQECCRSAPPAACTPAVRHSSRTAGSWSRPRRGRSASSAASPGLGAAHRAAHPRLPRTGPERATSVHRPVASQVSMAYMRCTCAPVHVNGASPCAKRRALKSEAVPEPSGTLLANAGIVACSCSVGQYRALVLRRAHRSLGLSYRLPKTIL